MPTSPWWKGERGEWYVVAQFTVFVMIALKPSGDAALCLPRSPVADAARWGGALFMASGGVLAAAGFFALGKNLAILPCPRQKGQLVLSGAYRLVRHPIYSGIIFAAFGWWLWNGSCYLLACSLLLFVVLDLKSRREERWLVEMFHGYLDYRKRVKRLIPFVY